MSNDIRACQKAKEFIEYLEAFSFANQLTNSISDETMSVLYNAKFGSYLLTIDFSLISDRLKVKVIWKPARAIMSNLHSEQVEFRMRFDSIKKVVKVDTASCEPMKRAMSFIVSDFGELNILIDLLTEGVN